MVNSLTFIRNKEIMHANQPINLRELLHAQPNRNLAREQTRDVGPIWPTSFLGVLANGTFM